MIEGVIGPTLLDLKDLLGVSVGEISFIQMMSNFGFMAGSFSTGVLLEDKFKAYLYLILGGTLYKTTVINMIINFFKFLFSYWLLHSCSFRSAQTYFKSTAVLFSRY